MGWFGFGKKKQELEEEEIRNRQVEDDLRKKLGIKPANAKPPRLALGSIEDNKKLVEVGREEQAAKQADMARRQDLLAKGVSPSKVANTIHREREAVRRATEYKPGKGPRK